MSLSNFKQDSIDQFTQSDTLYGTKKVGAYTYYFRIQFYKFEKGIVSGIILEIQPNNNQHIWIDQSLFMIGSIISFRISKCYTFSTRCHWFAKHKNGKWLCNN